jgi:hypothetical protein
MNLEQIKKTVSGLTNDKFVTLKIDISLFDDGSKKGYKSYNKYIKENVDKKYGVYIFFNPIKQTAIYIGMAGKLNKNSQPKQTLDERLTAHRYQNKVTNENINTNKWVFEIMKEHEIEELFIYVFYVNPKIPSAYIEALLLYNFYKIHEIIPIENSEF